MPAELRELVTHVPVWNGVPTGPVKASLTDISPVAALVQQITKVRNPHNNTPTRFNLLAGDICYANPSGNAVAIINPDGYGGSQPGDTKWRSSAWTPTTSATRSRETSATATAARRPG